MHSFIIAFETYADGYQNVITIMFEVGKQSRLSVTGSYTVPFYIILSPKDVKEIFCGSLWPIATFIVATCFLESYTSSKEECSRGHDMTQGALLILENRPIGIGHG